MSPIVYHVVSGHAWFSGIGLLLLAVFLQRAQQFRPPNHLLGKLVNVLWLVAVLLMLLASVAVNVWVYAWLVVSLVGWRWTGPRLASKEPLTKPTAAGIAEPVGAAVSGEARKAKRLKESSQELDRGPHSTAGRNRWARWMLAFSLLTAIAAELPYHFQPTLRAAGEAKMTIIGDSVTAGVGGNETSERWPEILQRVHGLQVQDISQMGETAKSATKRARQHVIDSPIIIVEIGGNDVLGGTSVQDFDRDLDELLQFVCTKQRQVVMFELPLPPLFHGYGYVQRRLAKKHGVKLLPKATFLAAIAGPDTTLDSIHLSQAGHQRMADLVWAVVEDSFDRSSGSVN